jgi:hypothetical protein
MLCFVIVIVMGFVAGVIPIESSYREDGVFIIFMALQLCDNNVEVLHMWSMQKIKLFNILC